MPVEYAPKNLTASEIQNAQQFGGADFDIYNIEDDCLGCDKGGHRERSIFHQPNHINHWTKVNQELRGNIEA
jgi:hypothetical protein